MASCMLPRFMNERANTSTVLRYMYRPRGRGDERRRGRHWLARSGTIARRRGRLADDIDRVLMFIVQLERKRVSLETLFRRQSCGIVDVELMKTMPAVAGTGTGTGTGSRRPSRTSRVTEDLSPPRRRLLGRRTPIYGASKSVDAHATRLVAAAVAIASVRPSVPPGAAASERTRKPLRHSAI